MGKFGAKAFGATGVIWNSERVITPPPTNWSFMKIPADKSELIAGGKSITVNGEIVTSNGGVLYA